LVNFVLNILQHRNFSEEKILEAIENAEDEMLQNGIVAVGDICNTANTISQKAKQRLRYYNFIETSGFIPQFAEARFQQAKDIFEKFTIHHSTFTSIVPHAPYSVSKELFELINTFSAGKISSIHNQESLEEEKFFKTGESEFEKLYQQLNIDISFFKPSGKSSLQTFLPWLKDASQLLLVHNTFASQGDIDFIQHLTSNTQQHFFCLCPNANLYIENTLPSIELFRKNSCELVLGTDSLASNHSLNILSEMKTIKQNFTAISIEEILQWATFNGAKALQMDDELGSFEKGKTPGIILIDKSMNDVKRLL
jgi:cytosine/adenosine deaminase-related metal-dependent hydrolase